MFHGRTLWRFHAIHHSSRAVDWLSSVRLHPLNDAVSRIAQVLPLYLMGFNGAALAAFVPS
jgi:sterol desaturase/sphingolipid hydroxylase (fatty acid hydroxylase superfamily)